MKPRKKTLDEDVWENLSQFPNNFDESILSENRSHNKKIASA